MKRWISVATVCLLSWAGHASAQEAILTAPEHDGRLAVYFEHANPEIDAFEATLDPERLEYFRRALPIARFRIEHSFDAVPELAPKLITIHLLLCSRAHPTEIVNEFQTFTDDELAEIWYELVALPVPVEDKAWPGSHLFMMVNQFWLRYRQNPDGPHAQRFLESAYFLSETAALYYNEGKCAIFGLKFHEILVERYDTMLWVTFPEATLEKLRAIQASIPTVVELQAAEVSAPPISGS